ncbi:phosphotransferase [Pelagicoccus sp. SDUM812005]|uniref:phosphotransferase n=1 Tax=Pelagicoccus sp. SDUM812005 TaxID=3041257 RepID=UPI00280FB5B1|nr:phosphotransferase [Pelagicoccus sp. SDUM812005]MDQ8179614.1 phosphotransferase [Pelagicoccus sp. SDUM812005]
MNEGFRKVLCRSLEAKDVVELETIQSLWSGYGKIARLGVVGGSLDYVVVKLVRIPNEVDHPRGWNSDFSHLRKIRSYEVEMAWYEGQAKACGQACRIPRCFATAAEGGEMMLALEDLDASGFSARKTAASLDDMKRCLSWLAEFHARFLGVEPEGLWPKGSYWHLDTRPDELAALEDVSLKKAAGQIDALLEGARFKTLVHGDAKLANFCFDDVRQRVAAVDFQYVGGGCGMKDVAYFIGSCLTDTDCERMEASLLDWYFGELGKALSRLGREADVEAIEREWRRLFPVAWTDFHRFLKGWSPGHWKVHSYSERLAREVVEGLGDGV